MLAGCGGVSEIGAGIVSIGYIRAAVSPAVGKKAVHHLTFDALTDVNRAVVVLSKEEHGYSEADAQKLRDLVVEVENRAEDREHDEAALDKCSLLVFKIASGQYFRAGNKRTALVAGTIFLLKNGHSLDISDPELVSMVDRVGIAGATLEELHAALERATKKAGPERKGWAKVLEAVVDTHRPFLTRVAS